MPVVKELQYHFGVCKKKQLESDIDYYERRSQSCSETILETEEKITHVQNKLEEYEATIIELWQGHGVSEGSFLYVCRALQNQVIRRQGEVSSLQSDKDYLENEIERIQKRLLSLRMSLAKVEDTRHTITTAQAKELLSQVNTIDRGSVRLLTSDQGPQLAWKFKGIKLTPERNDYYWLNSGKKVSFPLPDINVYLFLNSGEVRLRACRGDKHARVNGYTTGVHPHILYDNGTPCLGDFGANVVEAVKQNDLVGAALVLNMFLEYADPSDGAGIHWPKYLLAQIPGMRGIEYYTDTLPKRTREDGSTERVRVRVKDGVVEVIPVDDPKKWNERIGKLRHFRNRREYRRNGLNTSVFHNANRQAYTDPRFWASFYEFNKVLRHLDYRLDTCSSDEEYTELKSTIYWLFHDNKHLRVCTSHIENALNYYCIFGLDNKRTNPAFHFSQLVDKFFRNYFVRLNRNPPARLTPEPEPQPQPQTRVTTLGYAETVEQAMGF